ncbi:LCP family glycopolymer transferase [Microcella flavibacter]|uniref:LCP family glycopolymer transferase n=1 Tax=Microcella flavibacter TaxID=1804990 RepID=UPI001E638A77|nr:LCP family protein [Microcella flavibacter]
MARVRHGRQRRSAWWSTALKVVGATMAVVLVSGASVAAIALNNLTSNIDVVELTDADGNVREIPQVGEWEGGFNVLIVGVDNAEGQTVGEGRDTTLNDVNMLVHVTEDQQSAVAVSIPRDLVIRHPGCPQEDGSMSSPMSAQPLNVAYGQGGLNCVVLTVEELTGLDIPYAAQISFDGVAMMSTAVGGVDICITEPIIDRQADLVLETAGTHTVEGYQALAFLRTRYGVGDGSDLSRISSQQVYLSSLMRKVQNEGVLTDPTALYGIATVATQAMKLSPSLSSVDTMVSMALALRTIPTENITFVQYPATTGLGGVYTNKAAPLEDLADQLFERIQNGESFVLADDATGNGSTLDPNAPVAPPTEAPVETPAATDPAAPVDPSASPAPGDPSVAPEDAVLEGVLGQTADQYTCSVAN